MSRSWGKGSEPGWRKLRASVLARDQYVCQLRLDVCTHVATTAHHTIGKAVSGDDPAHIVAACAPCNLKVGNPAKYDPPAKCGIAW